MDSSRRRKIVNSLLYGALLAAAIFAAYQIHIFWVSPRPAAGPQRGIKTVGNPGGAASQPAPPQDPRELLKGPHGMEHAKPLAGDPGSIPPPATARRRYAFTFDLPGDGVSSQQTLQEYAHYDDPGPLEDIRRHYLAALEQAGYDLVADSGVQNKRELVFTKGRSHVTVSLTKAPGSGGVVIVVTMIRPTQTKPPDDK